MSNGDLYTSREQTLVKHFILRNCLERFAIIVGSRWDTLTYVDCFSGPWNVQSEQFQDSSFAIALEQLRKARKIHKDRTGRTLTIRCFFLEKKRSAYDKLKHFTDQIADVEIKPTNKALEDAVQDILDFVKQGGPKAFPFIFIDPTGWTGFAMATIAPLLKHKPGEILINFMTEHIRRFVDSPQQLTQESFKKLFGSGEFKDKLKGLAEKDREDALVTAYSERVKQVGAFGYTSSALVLHPGKDRTQFHLIYATRDPKGIEVFKSAEKKAMAVMEKARGEAHKREREERIGHSQLGLYFDNGTTQDPSAYFVSLRDRYTSRARTAVLSLIQTKPKLPYDEAWALAMTFPPTWKSNLRAWIREWEQGGQLETTGMQDKQRVPQLGQNIHLVWKSPTTSSSRVQHG